MARSLDYSQPQMRHGPVGTRLHSLRGQQGPCFSVPQDSAGHESMNRANDTAWLVRPHVITLADGYPVVAQNGVGGGDMKEKLRQAVVGQIGLTTQFLFFRRTRTQYDFVRFATFKL